MRLAKYLKFTLFIGAAREDASPQQLQRLRIVVADLLPDFRNDGNDEPIRQAIQSVMGENWTPSGEWKQWIEALDSPKQGR